MVLSFGSESDAEAIGFEELTSDVQKGMSGGPALLRDGRLIGQIVGFLDDPGRSSFINHVVGLRLLFKDIGRSAPEAGPGPALTDAELKALARTVTVRVHCYQ